MVSQLSRSQLGLEMGQLNDKPAIQESVRFREVQLSGYFSSKTGLLG
jgi:hypothetical protein